MKSGRQTKSKLQTYVQFIEAYKQWKQAQASAKKPMEEQIK